MRKAYFILAILSLSPIVMADTTPTPNDQLITANQFYEKGEFEKAGEIYNGLVSQGFEGTELYYNLGNLHFRKGERGKAVLWYKRAQLLSPRDGDISFNMGIAASHIKDDESNILKRIFLTFTINELCLALAVLLWIFFGIWGAKTMDWIKSESWPSTALWFSGLVLFLVVGWFGVAVAMLSQPEGVVVNPPGEVRNGPGQDYAVGFTIPEGSSVLLLTRRPDWTQVGVQNQGLKGWMPNNDVELVRITPPSLN